MVWDVSLGNVHFCYVTQFLQSIYLESDVVSFGVRLNEEGKRNGQRKKTKLKVSFIIRAAMEESILKAFTTNNCLDWSRNMCISNISFYCQIVLQSTHIYLYSHPKYENLYPFVAQLFDL